MEETSATCLIFLDEESTMRSRKNCILERERERKKKEIKKRKEKKQEVEEEKKEKKKREKYETVTGW